MELTSVRVGDVVTETFFVPDPSNPTVGKTGLAPSAFTIVYARYGTSNLSFSALVSFSEIGRGEYALSFTPTATGTHRIQFAASTGDYYLALYLVQPATARLDEPFARRVGDPVYVYYSVVDATGAPVTDAAGSFTLQYARDPDGVTFVPTLVLVGQGEYYATFTPTKAGSYRALWTDGIYTLQLEIEVLSASATTASGLTRTSLRREIADRLGYLVTGTITTATSSTVLLDTSRFEPQNHFNGGYLYLTSGACAGQSRRITNWNSSTKTFTLAPAFTGTVALGDTYEAYLGHPIDRYNRAIDAAIRAYAHLWGTDVVDSATLVTSTVDTYAIPSGIDVLYGVELQVDQTYNLYQPIPAGRWGWEALLEGSSPKVRFHKDVLRRYATASYFIRFRGQQDAQTLTTDSDKTMIPSTVIVPWACAYLLRTQNQGIASGESARAVPDFLNEVQGALLLEPPGRTFQSDSVRVRQ